MAATTAMVCVLLGACGVAGLAVLVWGRVQVARIQAGQDGAPRKR
ncbi:hypothetical protein ACOZDE_18910 [Streptomyces griseoincarnatus]